MLCCSLWHQRVIRSKRHFHPEPKPPGANHSPHKHDQELTPASAELHWDEVDEAREGSRPSAVTSSTDSGRRESLLGLDRLLDVSPGLGGQGLIVVMQRLNMENTQKY